MPNSNQPARRITIPRRSVRDERLTPVVTWDVTSRCNLKCSHCSASVYAPARATSKELTLDECLQVVDRLAEGGVGLVRLEGGEPLCRPGIERILARGKERGLRFAITTNGTLLDEQMVEMLLSFGHVDQINISFEGHTASLNDPVRGVGTFTKAERHLRSLLERRERVSKPGVQVVVNVVATAVNLCALEAMYDYFVREAGADLLNLNLFGALRDPQANRRFGLSITTYFEAICQFLKCQFNGRFVGDFSFALQTPRVRQYLASRYQITFPDRQFRCVAGRKYGYVDYRGQLHLCKRLSFYDDQLLQVTRTSLGYMPISLRDRSVAEAYASPFARAFWAAVARGRLFSRYEPCRSCRYLGKECLPCPIPGIECHFDPQLPVSTLIPTLESDNFRTAGIRDSFEFELCALVKKRECESS